MQWFHMQSVGNSFAVVDGRGGNLNFPELARKLCSIADADGFMALGESERADFRLHFYNRDGSRAAMCGNGCRCICKFAYDLGIVGDQMTVQTDAGILPGKRLADTRYQIGLPAPTEIRLNLIPGIDFCICGVPHGVVQVQALKKETLLEKARRLRNDLNCNVNFYTPSDGATVNVLTYERGVEDFTAACGTGCGAVAAALHKAGKLLSNQLTAINPGGKLKMEIAEDRIFQTGNAEVVHIYNLSQP